MIWRGDSAVCKIREYIKLMYAYVLGIQITDSSLTQYIASVYRCLEVLMSTVGDM